MKVIEFQDTKGKPVALLADQITGIVPSPDDDEFSVKVQNGTTICRVTPETAAEVRQQWREAVEAASVAQVTPQFSDEQMAIFGEAIGESLIKNFMGWLQDQRRFVNDGTAGAFTDCFGAAIGKAVKEKA